MKFLYILSQYPCPSETFIQREIDALRKSGACIFIYTLKAASNPINKQNVFYRHEIGCIQKAKYLIDYFVNNRRWFWRTIKIIIVYWRDPLYLIKLIRNTFPLFFINFWIQQNQIQCIHAHFSDMATDLAMILSKLSGIPYTFSAHARDVFVKPLHLNDKCMNAEKVITCSHYLTQRINSITRTENLQTIYHGIPLNDPIWDGIYNGRMKNWYQLYDVGQPLNLLAIGRFVRKKGFHIIIEACHRLNMANVQFSCTIVGGGREYQNLISLARSYHLTDFVRFSQALPISEILLFYKQAHCLIVPSIIDKDGDQDNIPNVILEAQALGVPVLASDLTSIREVIDNKNTGFLMPMNQPEKMAAHIQDNMKNTSLLKNIVQNAHQQIHQNFDIDVNVQKMTQIWEDAVHESIH